MQASKLTGIERELVLQYLIDGNVPVTVTPIENPEEKDFGTAQVKPATSALFPIAIKAEQLKVIAQGIILLTTPPENVKNFIGKSVRVEFYFNRLGLYFETTIKQIKAGLALVIPSSISRMQETTEKERPTEFRAQLYFSVNKKTDIHIDCLPKEGYDIFARPVWKDIQEESQQKAKVFLEKFIAHARTRGTAGSGVQLIPVVRYLAEKVVKKESIQGRQNPLEVIFVNHERIVFGAKTENIDLKDGTEYALEMSLPMPKPLTGRKIFATCRVESNYSDESKELTCAVCRYTSLQEEDIRFLYEKCSGEKFI